jgi:hypothetical protein
MPTQQKRGAASITRYKSLQHASDHIKNEYARASNLHDHYMSTRDKGDGEFYGSISLSEARKIIATTGYYKKGADLITQARINTPQSTQVTTTSRNQAHYTGHRPSVPRALAGAPKSMIRRRHQQRQLPVARIAIATMADCGIKDHQLANYGAAVLSCINALERQRVAVYADIVSCWSTRYDSKTTAPSIVITIPVKTPQHNLSTNELSFLLTHPASIRRFQFALLETDPNTKLSKQMVSGCYGYPFTPTKGQLPDYDVVTPALISNEIYRDYDTPQKALKIMQALFAAQTKNKKQKG